MPLGNHGSFLTRFSLPPFLLYRSLFSFFTLAFILVFSSCASLYKSTLSKPLDTQQIKNILYTIKEQDKKVSSFYNLGNIIVKNWLWESEANILVAGTRNPFRIKIEITHAWGQPILHFLIDGGILEVLSFSDNKRYHGQFTPKALSKFIPCEFDENLIWAALRGYPSLLEFHGITSSGANQITLFDEGAGEVQRIELYPESLLPKQIFLPKNLIRLAFQDFEEDNGIYYAKEVRANDMDGRRSLIVKSRKMSFNRIIPDQIFFIEKPPNFENLSLEKIY